MFINCSASVAEKCYGGACNISAVSLVLSRCCGRSCWCDDWGQFLFISPREISSGGTTASRPISQVLLLDCGGRSDYDGIFLETGMAAGFSSLNITSCSGRENGAAFYGEWGDAIYSLQYLNVAGCSGKSIVANKR
jgi:hypothetical protein